MTKIDLKSEDVAIDFVREFEFGRDKDLNRAEQFAVAYLIKKMLSSSLRSQIEELKKTISVELLGTFGEDTRAHDLFKSVMDILNRELE